jgi:transcriptional regulator of acetoin/glycerol metabolism
MAGGFGRNRMGKSVNVNNVLKTSLARHKGNISQAAQQLGISRPTLYELMEKLGIR